MPVYNLTLSQPNAGNYDQVGHLAAAAGDANTLDSLPGAFKNGVAETLLYELFDEASDPDFTKEKRISASSTTKAVPSSLRP